MDRQMTKLYAHRAATDPTYKCRRIMRKRSWRNGARLPGSKRSGRWRPRTHNAKGYQGGVVVLGAQKLSPEAHRGDDTDPRFTRCAQGVIGLCSEC